MRVSCDQRDPAFAPGQFRIWIDGIERSNVITADEEQRMALCVVLDVNGRPVIDELKREIKREWVQGLVRIEPAVPPLVITDPGD